MQFLKAGFWGFGVLGLVSGQGWGQAQGQKVECLQAVAQGQKVECLRAVDLPLLGFGLLFEHRGVSGGVLRRLVRVRVGGLGA